MAIHYILSYTLCVKNSIISTVRYNSKENKKLIYCRTKECRICIYILYISLDKTKLIIDCSKDRAQDADTYKDFRSLAWRSSGEF